MILSQVDQIIQQISRVKFFLQKLGVVRAHADGPVRLYVDRVFTLRGIGTVATGTLWSGAIAAGDVLRAEPGGEIRVWGSTELIRTLARHNLIDEYRLAVYPLVLGTGKKLFPDEFAPGMAGDLRRDRRPHPSSGRDPGMKVSP